MKNNNQRWWDVPAAIFLVGALFSAALRLQATQWTEHLGRTEFIVVLGAIFGFALGKSIFRGWQTFVMGLIYTVVIIPWQLCLLMPQAEWLDRLNVVYARMWYATADFISNKPVRDPILFLATMMLLYWLASLLASYRLVRRADPWLPLLSLGGMILVIEYTTEINRVGRATGTTYSFLFLLLCLLLVGRIYFLRSKKDWEQRGGTVEMEVGYDLGRGVAIAAVVVALLAWNTPRVVNLFDSKNPARERVSQSWQAFKDRISKAANSLRSQNPTLVEGYGSNMFLGTGGNLTEKLMFTVSPDGGRTDVRMYWTARTFDLYTGSGQWQATINGTRDVGPSKMALVYPDRTQRSSERFTFVTDIPLLKTLFYVNETLNISVDAQAIVSEDAEGQLDLTTISMDPPLKAGSPYAVRANVSNPTVLALRESGEEYPEWIKERYLQMPDDFSPRITELARQIAGEELTPYDKAVAVTQYLRRTITYTESVPEPPRNRDPLEWFLFDQRAGFCNYYASAEVLMLRSLGVPARLVVGYAEGTWDPEQELYTVLGKDSHAWPEVYFPTLGWIAFEPTVSQPASTFPLGEERDDSPGGSQMGSMLEPTFDPRSVQADVPNEERWEDEMYATRSNFLQMLPTWAYVVTGLALVAGILALLESRRRKLQDLPLPSWIEKTLDERGVRTPDWLRLWSRRALRTPMETLFASVSMMLRVWGQKVDPAYTPAEQVTKLVEVVPDVKEQAVVLLEEYERAMYSQYPANWLRASEAVKEMRSVGYRNWLMRLVGLDT